MQYRQLGRSGLRVSALTLGTMTFGGAGAFAKVGATDVEGAGRLVERCRDAGVNMLDTANIYSAGLSEEIIGQVMHGRWGDMLVATKARMRTGSRPQWRRLVPPAPDRRVREEPEEAPARPCRPLLPP